MVMPFQVSDGVRVELKGNGSECALGGYRKSTFKDLSDAAIRSRIVNIGDSAADEISRDIAVVRLPLAIIAFAANRSEGRVPQTPFRCSVPEPEVSRVLVQQ